MKKVALVIALAFTIVSFGSLLMGINMDYRSGIISHSFLIFLIALGLDCFGFLYRKYSLFLDFINFNNRNFKKSLLEMDEYQFEEEKDNILDLADKKRARQLFKVYEEIRIKRKESKKTHSL